MSDELPLRGALPSNRGAPVVRRPAIRAFWALFYALFVLLLLLTTPSLGKLDRQAVIAQGLCLLWALAIALHGGGKKRAEYAVAGVAVFAFLMPLSLHVVLVIYGAITHGIRDANGSATPFLLRFLFEMVLFLPLTLLAVLFVVGKPWRKP